MNHPSILGIDVSSKKLDICLISSNEDNDPSYFSLDYCQDNLSKFMLDHPEIDHGHCLIGMESTGDYHLLAARFFLEAGFPVKILNPILTKQYTRTTIRGIKTDKTDSFLIAKLIKEGNGQLVNLKQLANQRKESLRLSIFLGKLSFSLKQKLSSLNRRKAQISPAITNKLEFIRQELEELEELIVKEVITESSEQEALIDSIPGFAEKLSAIVSVELGDVKRFKNSKSLVAFAGLDPKIRQSGPKLNTQGRLTKRGSPHLRTALFLASNIARRFDKNLHDYYEKKKSEGRSYKEIMCMISRKLLARIYAVLKEQKPYTKTLT